MAALPLMLLVLLQPCCQVWIEGVQLVCPARAKQTPQMAVLADGVCGGGD